MSALPRPWKHLLTLRVYLLSMLCVFPGGWSYGLAQGLLDHTPLTYNMQGATTGNDNKWILDVAPLTVNHDVVALQEAGSPPSSAILVEAPEDTPEGRLTHWTWNAGTGSRPQIRHIYHLQTDPAGNRVNMAIVLRDNPADEVTTVPAGFPGARGALGIRLGGTWFYTFHGQAGNGNDGAPLLRTIAGRTPSPFIEVVLGDFNRDPATLTLPANWTTYTTGQATQRSGGELDYMATNQIVRRVGPSTNEVRGRLLPGRSSDHFPVDFPVYTVPPNPPNPAPTLTLRIMPPGDQVTAGNGSSTGNGYRYFLRAGLAGRSSVSGSGPGDSVLFVGSNHSGTMDNNDNEGHPGLHIDELSTIVGEKAGLYRPNVVTLQAGSNDILQGYQLSTAPDRLGALIDQFYNSDPDATTLVSELAPASDPQTQARIAAFNQSIPEVLRPRQQSGKHLLLVNSEDIDLSNLADPLIPNDTGYAKLAGIGNGRSLKPRISAGSPLGFRVRRRRVIVTIMDTRAVTGVFRPPMPYVHRMVEPAASPAIAT